MACNLLKIIYPFHIQILLCNYTTECNGNYSTLLKHILHILLKQKRKILAISSSLLHMKISILKFDRLSSVLLKRLYCIDV